MLFRAAVILSCAAAMVAAQSTSSDVFCYTQKGSRRVTPVPSSTTTTTVRYTETKTTTVYPTKTVTPPPKTVTATKYSTAITTTTANTITETFSSTTTSFVTTTETSTATVTETTVSDVFETSTTPVVIPTAPGFRPVRDTVNEGPGGGGNPIRNRAIGHPRAEGRSLQARQGGGGSGGQYPQRVTCIKVVQIYSTKTITRTGRTTRTTTIPPSTTTRFVTSAITSTSTVAPRATVTSTFSTTSTITASTVTTETRTVTSTNTQTVSVPGATSYAACSSENIFGPDFTHEGTPYQILDVYNNGPNSATTYQFSFQANAVACCEACQRYPAGGCETFGFFSDGSCLVLTHTGQVCTSQSRQNFFVHGQSLSYPVTVGNGNCGTFYSAAGRDDGSLFTVDQPQAT